MMEGGTRFRSYNTLFQLELPMNPWQAYRSRLWTDPGLGVSLDTSRMPRPAPEVLSRMPATFTAMDALEAGAVANPDEGRMVGHYWLRDPERAPSKEIAAEIRETGERIRAFARAVHDDSVRPERARRFRHLLLIGIGGSALGPQFVAHALAGTNDPLRPHFIDNTDPDGIDRVLGELGDDLTSTLVLVVSKSGGTRETRNGMHEVQAAYERAGLVFGRHAVAVTGVGSALEDTARRDGFLDVFPMWDWVGGRTSVLSVVGLLPAALQGLDVDGLLDGAREMDRRTRIADYEKNPAALLAGAWHAAGNGRGDRDMVVLPYKDRLLLFSRYLQQLVMESLGKKLDLEGNVVHQGIVVYGNKGSTDQHAYVQQLREGPDNFFVTFIEVLADREGPSVAVEADVTAGDYLLGFLLGTRRALAESGRGSITLTVPDVSARTLGMMIALYERAVGFYASLVGINAYHQPGVEAGKKAAEAVLDLQQRALARLREEPGRAWDLEELAAGLDAGGEAETLFKILEHASRNPDHGVERVPGAFSYRIA